MLFNSIEFILFFFPITFFVYKKALEVNRNIAIIWLAAASLFFYLWWDVKSLPILLLSIIANYLIGSMMQREVELESSRRRTWLVLGIVLNLTALFYYKYSNFIFAQLTDIGLTTSERSLVNLPIGISFFTFTQIAYLVDVYRNEVKEYNPVHYLLFVSYFPHLIAGPILHHKEMMPQFQKASPFTWASSDIATGLGIFAIGLAKKLLIADPLGFFANKFFSGVAGNIQPGLFESIFGTLAYTFQLYFDFSGYSDMAVGISKMMGINLPINFNSPYKSSNIIEFWRRWHMTLSRFLRDYLYIALGGNRNGNYRRYLNLFLTMVLGGIWHGAGWPFLIWGMLHGSYLMINHAWRHLVGESGFGSWNALVSKLYLPLTFVAVAIAWVPFRAASLTDAWQILKGLIGLNGAVLPAQIVSMVPFISGLVKTAGSVPLLADGTIMGFIELIVLIVIAATISFFFNNAYQMTDKKRLTVAAILTPLLFQKVFFGGEVEFLYFQF